MPDEQNDPLRSLARLAASAASMSGGLTLQLWRHGLLDDDARADFEKKLREMARDFEEAGAESAASQLWTAANLLQKPSP